MYPNKKKIKKFKKIKKKNIIFKKYQKNCLSLMPSKKNKKKINFIQKKIINL